MFMPQPVIKTYYQGLDEGKIFATKCSKCGHVEWPPVPTCDECGSLDMEWTTIEGAVTVEDIHLTSPMYKYGLMKQFDFDCIMEGRLDPEGTPVSGAIFGITPENFDEYKAKLPFAAKAKIVELADNFKTVLWEVSE